MTVISDRAATPGTGSPGRLSRAQLSEIVAGMAAWTDHWRALVRFDPTRRWYRRMELTSEYEVWLLSWQPGQGTGFHDHGGSAGSFAVALGELQELTVPGGSRQIREVAVRTMTAGGVRSFGSRFVHHVVNNSAESAVSVHAYSPPLPRLRRYELTPAGLRYIGTEPAKVSA
jgi:predicted metal-dependent enzyme (double-stranded beta helix superfamily)